MRNFEQELKLELDQREYGILSGLTTQRPQLQTNYYFAAAKVSQNEMIRLRERGGRFTLCYKARVLQKDGITVSEERECEVEIAFANAMIRRGILPKEINAMLKTDFDETLVCVGSLQTHRTKFQFQEWTLELDKNYYFDRCDYELECESNNVQHLDKLKNFLSYNYGIVIRYSKPKSQRFYEAAKRL